eukprot:g2130.t1
MKSMYVSQTEHKYLYGGRREKREVVARAVPFDHCQLTFRPWQNPVGTADGSVFELLAILPYIRKHKTHPITGKKIKAKDLKKLTFHRNKDGKIHCPVTMKVFTPHSHIVANFKSGHVLSYDAVKELNIKAKNWEDLVTGEPFEKSDIVTIQNPKDSAKNIVVDASKVSEAKKLALAAAASKEEASKSNIRVNEATQRIFDEVDRARDRTSKKRKVDRVLAKASNAPRSRFTSGMCASSFTSTAMAPVTSNQRASLSPEELAKARYDRVRKLRKKGYVRMRTTLGELNLELHCDVVPRTCENFLTLAKKGYYDGVIFHRLIKNFMIQGGDPTGTGRGGESCWGGKFDDEFSGKLRHDSRGVLSMANAGPNSNGSQFFVTFKSCRHLDNKHSVFGRVVGGLSVLRALELSETDDDDRPKSSLRIVRCEVFVDPFTLVDAAVEPKDEDAQKQSKKRKAISPTTPAASLAMQTTSGSGVGKYLKRFDASASSGSRASEDSQETTAPPLRSKKAPAKTSFGNFSGW